MQCLRVKQDQVILIKNIKILSMNGRLLRLFEHDEFCTGFINLYALKAGNYQMEFSYYDDSVNVVRFTKY